MSAFIHRIRHRPTACQVASARPTDRPGNTAWIRRVDSRPARWQVAADVDPGWDDPSSLVGRHLSGAPVRRAFYVGRVEDMSATGVDAVVWERLSGRCTRVFIDHAYIATQPEVSWPGDRVCLWTWEEAGTTGLEPRRIAEVHQRPLSDETRRQLRSIVTRWDEDG